MTDTACGPRATFLAALEAGLPVTEAARAAQRSRQHFYKLARTDPELAEAMARRRAAGARRRPDPGPVMPSPRALSEAIATLHDAAAPSAVRVAAAVLVLDAACAVVGKGV